MDNISNASNLLNEGLLENALAFGIGEENTSLGISRTEESSFSSVFAEELSPIERLQIEEAKKNTNNSVFPHSSNIVPSVPFTNTPNSSQSLLEESESIEAAVNNINIDTLFPHPEPIEGDADGDCDIDYDDVRAISAARNTPATGSDDVRDLDNDGTITVLDGRKLTVTLRRNTDFDAPVVNLGLTNDTGVLNDDNITSDFRLSGQIDDESPVTSLKAGFDDTAPEDYIKIVSVLNEDGSFALNNTQLEAINGGALSEGEHTFYLQAKDKWANEAETLAFNFTLDTTPPPLNIQLDSNSDTGELGDNVTTEDTVNLTGQTEPNSIVTLGNIEAIADTEGNFTFTDIELGTVGENNFDFTATDLAGNQSTTSLTITREEVSGTAPVINGELANDTGESDRDNLTLDPTITGTITTDASIDKLEASINNSGFVDISSGLNNDNSFEVSLEEYVALTDSLADGNYSIELRATDSNGRVSNVDRVDFTLDRSEPPITLELAPDSDTGEQGDNLTTERTVTLQGETDPGLRVVLVQTQQETVADSDGNFSFSDVPLAIAGDKLFTAVVEDAAGNQGRASQTITREGINGAPTITSIPETSIDSGETDTYTYQVTATDPDGDELSYALLNAPLGAEIDANGLISFELPDNPLPTYNFTVEVSDGRGGRDTQTFSVSTSDIFTGNGVIEGLKWNDLNGNGVRDTDLVQGANPDVIFTIDVSGSADFDFVGSPIGDVNGDGLENTRLDAEIEGFIRLNQQLVNQGFSDRASVGIVVFSGNTANADMNLAVDGIQLTTTPGADTDGNGVTDVEEILRSIRSGAFGVGNFTGTNPEAALQKVEETFTNIGTEAENGNLIFLTDGEQNRGGSINDEVERLRDRGFNLSAFGVGDDASLDIIQTIDPDGIKFTSTDELLNVFDNLDGGGGTLEPGLAGVSIYLDINNNGLLDAGEPVRVTASDDPSTSDIDETGEYRFTNLAPDTYIVREVVPENFQQTFPIGDATAIGDGFADVVLDFFDSGNGILQGAHGGVAPDFNTPVANNDIVSISTDVVLGNDTDEVDFLILPEGSSITVGFNDETIIDGSGDDIFIAEFIPRDERANVFVSSDSENFVLLGVADGGTTTALDLADINFQEPVEAVRIVALNQGSGTPGFELANIQVLPDSIASPDFYTVELDENETVSDLDFGNQELSVPGIIQGTKFNDLNTNGVRDTGFTPSTGSDVTATSSSEGILLSNDAVNLQVRGGLANNGLVPFDGFYRYTDIAENEEITWSIDPLLVFEDGSTSVLSNGSTGGFGTPTLINGDTARSTATTNDIDVQADTELIGTNAKTTFTFTGDNLEGTTFVFYAENDIFTFANDTADFTGSLLGEDLALFMFDSAAGGLSNRITAETIQNAELTQFGSGIWTGFGTRLENGDLSDLSADGSNFVQTGDLGLAYAFELSGTEASLVINYDSDPQPPEPGLADWVIYLDDNNNSQRDADEQFTLTDANGNYQFGDLEPGTYTVREEPQPGFIQTTVPEAYRLRVVNGDVFTNINFGNAETNTGGENRNPFITSTPITEVIVDTEYTYNVQANDPDGDSLTYTLLTAPDGMTIDNEGLITWNPDVLGSFTVEIEVSDGNGGVTTQSYEVIVSETINDNEDPTVNLGFNSSVLEIGETLDLQIQGFDNVAVADLDLTINGTSLTLTPDVVTNGTINTASFSSSDVGVFEVVATATDTAGNTDTKTQTIRFIDPSDTEAPDIQIPLDQFDEFDPVIRERTDLIGTIEDDIEFYRVELAPTSQIDFDNLAADDPSFITVAEGTEGVDGVLATIDPTLFRNDSYYIRIVAQDFNGNLNAQGVILGIDTPNKPGEFSQEFVDLSVPLTGVPIEITRRYSSLDSVIEGDFGFGWSLGLDDGDIVESAPTGVDLTQDDFFGGNSFTIGTRVTLNTPDGRRVGFTFQPEVDFNSLIGTVYKPTFVPDPGVFDTLEVPDFPLSLRSDGSVRLFFLPFTYNPSEYTLTTRDGTQYSYEQNEGLQTVVDRNGNTLTFTDDGIESSTGVSIDFIRDSQGRIERIIDPEGESIEYGYNTAGDLVSVIDREENETTLKYEADRPHYLTEITDPLGRSGTRIEYGDDGRISRFIDADGNALDINFGDAADFQTIEDPLGNTTTLFYDDRGNVVRQVDPTGGETTFTYDEANNVLTRTDAEENTTTFTYDNRGNVLTETDGEGNTTTFTYNEFNSVLTTTNALGEVATNLYDDNGNLLRTTDAENNTTTYDYDARGNLTQQTDANGNVTEFDYNSFGLLTSITQTLNGAELVSTLGYDNNGNLTSITTPEGRTTTFAYDDENRLTTATDPAGNTSRIEYDAAGQRRAIVDALGRRTRFEYNDRGLLTKTIFADGTEEVNEYDVLDRLTSTTDPNENETQFEYNALNELTAVIDAANNRTTYGRDLVGNLITQTDALNRTTTYTYDGVNRLLTTELPLGQTFTNTYDAVGNIVRTNDFKGDVLNYDYDGLGQLLEISTSSNTALESFTYTPTGQIATINDERGLTTFSYDELDRLTRRTDPDNTFISYTYDGDDNITSLTTPSGTVGYTYDLVGFLDTVTERDGSVTDYDYDKVGNLTQTTFGNGVIETRDYDLLNRVEELTTTDSNGNVLASYEYTFDDLGNRLTETDNTGRVTSYEYNEINQVTEVAVTDASLGNETTNYEYDDAGNLIRETNSSGETVYTYDNNDRLIREESNGQIITYNYDDAGNRIDKRINGIIVEVYDWNIQGELASASITKDGNTTNTEYEYNSDGIRVSQTVDGVETNFLIDNNQQEFAQVIEEYTPGEIIQVVYTHGQDLISQVRGSDKGYYHTDSLGSTRLLTNESGNVINTYLYDAYGKIINQTEVLANSYKFTGEQFDSKLENYYLRARYYNPATGRFVSRDSFAGFLERPLSLNDYLYGEGNPINAIDPSGEVAAVEYIINVTKRVGLAASIGLRFTGRLLFRNFDLKLNALLVFLNLFEPPNLPPFGDFEPPQIERQKPDIDFPDPNNTRENQRPSPSNNNQGNANTSRSRRKTNLKNFLSFRRFLANKIVDFLKSER